MKKISIFVLLTIIVICFSSCSLFSMKKDKNKFELETPQNLVFNEERTTLSWSKVSNATSYTVKINYQSGEEKFLESSTNSLYLSGIKSGKIQVSVMAKNEDSQKKSNYCNPITVSFLSPLDIAEKSVKSRFSQGILSVSWDKVENADGYVLTYQVGTGDINTAELLENKFELSLEKANLNCQFTIYAKGSGDYKDGRKIHYLHFGEPDFENPLFTVTADLNESDDAEFSFSYLYKAELDGADISELIESSSKVFKIPCDFLQSVELGEHNLALWSVEEVRTYKLEVINSKTPEIAIGNYVYDGENLVGELQAYGNEILGICGFYESLNPYQGEIKGNKVILYSTFLDSKPEGELKLNIAYKSPKSDSVKYLAFSVQISSKAAELKSFSFTYDGKNDLAIDIETHGDKVVKLYADGAFVPSYYYTASNNTLEIKKGFLDEKERKTFIITTKMNATLSFVLQYASKGFIPTNEIYSFDKAGQDDLHIEGVGQSLDISIFGNRITSDDYFVKNNNPYINSAYLKNLDSGIYEFAIFSNGVYQSFSVRVSSSKGEIKNLKLDYDSSKNHVFVVFDCDCTENEHLLKINGEQTNCVSGDIVPNLDRTKPQTITLVCSALSSEKTWSINPPSESREYLTNSYSLNGKERDLYIESTEELSFALSFISLGGNGIITDNSTPNGRSELTVFFSDQYLNYAKAHDSYFEEASSLVNIPYNCRFSINGVGNVITLTATFYYNPNEIFSSGKQKEQILDKTLYLQRGNRAQNFSAFPINSFEKEELITTIADLERLSYGVRPVFLSENHPTYKLYEKALTICRTYISNDMSDFEKVLTFYHFLTRNVTYDTNALELYHLFNSLAELSLNDAKNAILSVLSSNGTLDKILSPLLNLNSAQEIKNSLFEKVSRLSSFSSYGALVDGVAVCDGISSAMKLLCNIEGIECLEVTGIGLTSSGGERHSWNKVRLQGKWYIVDATWGRNSGYINHRYFMIDENDAKQTHIENPDDKMNTVVDIPATGIFDYYAWNVEPYTNGDMRVQSLYEFKNLVSTLKANNEVQFEIKLDFEYSSVTDVMKSLNLTCKYFVFDNIVLIIL